MIDPTVAFDKLSNFETCEEIRIFFQLEGIKAVRGAHDNCPIAKWLTNTTGEGGVSVGSDTRIGVRPVIKMLPDGNTSYHTIEAIHRFEHSDAIIEFIEMFDEGHYPE